MAVWTVGADGKAPDGARPGDQIVTGGGIYEVQNDGSGKKVSDLSAYNSAGVATTGSAAVVAEAAARLKGIYNSASGGLAPADQNASKKTDTITPAAADENGIVYTQPTGIQGYNPGDYAASSGSSSVTSAGLSNIIGYVVIALIGIALLDRFVNQKR